MALPCVSDDSACIVALSCVTGESPRIVAFSCDIVEAANNAGDVVKAANDVGASCGHSAHCDAGDVAPDVVSSNTGHAVKSTCCMVHDRLGGGASELSSHMCSMAHKTGLGGAFELCSDRSKTLPSAVGTK